MDKPYEVVWSGASRQYLSPTLQPPATPPALLPVQTPPPTATDAVGWARGEHLRSYDLPRLRLSSSLQTAPGPFTVRQFAVAARVSTTRARSYLDEMVVAGKVQPVSGKPPGRALRYERA